MGLGFMLVLAPWVARNEIQFDSARVNSRGELILWGRAILNNMSNDEVLGLLYDQAPTLYKRAVAGTRLAEHEGDYRTWRALATVEPVPVQLLGKRPHGGLCGRA